MNELARKVWREAAAPRLTDAHLEVLKTAIEQNDGHIIQGRTTRPLATLDGCTRACEGACLLAYPLWQVGRINTVGELETAFAKFCFEMDEQLGAPAACRHLLNWYDDTPREEALREVYAEVVRELEKRRQKHEAFSA